MITNICKIDSIRPLASTAGIILLYFPLSIGLTFYQKWFLKLFHYPLTVVTFHICTKYLISWIYRLEWHRWYGKRVELNWQNTSWRILLMGFASGIDIGFSNWGLEFITVSLYTMTKSTTVIFILFFAIILKLEKKSWFLVAIVVMISGGLFMFTYKATQFDFLAFSLVLLASFASGIRWTVAQLIMQRSEIGVLNPLDMVYFVQPWMLVSLIPLSLVFEGKMIKDLIFASEASKEIGWSAILYAIIGGIIALLMECSEYLIVCNTSSLTLSVSSIVKEILTLTIAIVWSGDQMSALNFIGLLCCLSGIVLHVVHKAMKQKKNIERNINEGESAALFLANISASSDDHDGEDSSDEVLFSVLKTRD